MCALASKPPEDTGWPVVLRSVGSRVSGTLIKHEVSTREEFLAGMTVGVDLLLPALNRSTRHVPS